MSHLPFWSGAVSWMWPSIHAGQARTANWSFLKPWSQFGWKLARLAEMPGLDRLHADVERDLGAAVHLQLLVLVVEADAAAGRAPG